MERSIVALVAAEGGHNASMAQNILEVSYTGPSYIANELKTIMALSALTVTSFVLLEELWPDTTEEMTGVTNYQLLECSREMFEMVSCEQTDVLSSVNFKYSTPALRLTFPHYTSQVIGLDFLGSLTIQSQDKWSSRDLNDQSFPSKEPKRLQIITFLVFSFQSAAYLVFHSNLTFWANCFLEYLQTLFARQIM